ncbi:MAG: anthranilate synthase component I family protein [Candidatus Melainabacteria bacterium]|nr:anthranilate synthase component I family protein [Candidatus Melainabacteria bacterium]
MSTATPYIRSILSDVETPVSLYHKLSQDEPTAFLLESTEGDSRLARYSILGVSPAKTVLFSNGQATLHHVTENRTETRPFSNPLSLLQELLQQYQQSLGISATPGKSFPGTAELPFSGGWVGYLGYGATRYFDGIVPQQAAPIDVPEGFYGLYDSVILFDHLYRRITFISHRPEAEAQALWEVYRNRMQAAVALPPLSVTNTTVGDDALFATVDGPFNKARFCQAVSQCKQYIEQGQVFQIVLAQRFSRPVQGTPLTMYRLLQAVNPSPYAYLLQGPGFSYLGSSPETFVRCQQGRVFLRALAGTRRRGRSESEDQALEAELLKNEKELAEHRMLVDLGRNDLGRVCEVGSIRVGKVATLTRYTHVMHLGTDIEGQLRSDKSCFEVFQSCFPRGTVTGAPKIRAMELLSSLEPEQRGIYSGVVGYFDFLGNMDGAIAIRSAVIKDGMAHVNAGAGVVYDSIPEQEYQETQNKARSVLTAIYLAEEATQA